MKGLSWQSLKANYSLIPLFSIVTIGLVMAGGHAIRSLVYSSDVKVNRRNSDHPWDAKVNSDGSFQHSKYFKIHDYRNIRKSEYEPNLDN
ncbi:unnamed protein product [Adineta steineri]|uniref:Uncharacterized protein n=1 Tax=Adineta steineri TaxID=433720 RepID=A0A815J0B9_9BILA|nr:unnamed protein product [Adineta steineri]CAF1375367.1 unnamed protein product [Adineta steineri]